MTLAPLAVTLAEMQESVSRLELASAAQARAKEQLDSAFAQLGAALDELNRVLG